MIERSGLNFIDEGLVQLKLNNWSDALSAFKKSLKFKSSAHAFWLSAVARMEGRQCDQLGRKKTQIVADLEKASEFNDCPEEAILLLSQLIGEEERNLSRKLNILEKGNRQYPQSRELCLQLSELYFSCFKKHEQALEVLKPLLKNKPDSKVFWRAFLIAKDNRDADSALSFIERIKFPESNKAIVSKLKGDAFFDAGRYDEAIRRYNEALSQKDSIDKVYVFFNIAACQLKKENFREVVANLKSAFKIYFSLPSTECVISTPFWIHVDGKTEDYDSNQYIEDLCKNVLAIPHLYAKESQEFEGQLRFLLYKVKEFFVNEEGDKQLMQAQMLFKHPTLTQTLATFHLGNKDYIQGIRHHFEFCFGMLNNESKSFDPDDARILIDKDPHMRKTTRIEIYNEIMKLGNECDITNKEIEGKIFLPFYRSFFRGLLFDGRMHQEVRTFLSTFCLVEEASEIFDYAYAAHMDEEYKEAEKFYRLVLEKNPNNGSASNNLSLIFEEKNDLVEALDFAKKAAEAEPKNESYIARYEQFSKNVYHQAKSTKKQTAGETKPPILDGERIIVTKEITKSLRFEIFKRDNFTCQYCGRQTPTVILEIDHIIPKVEGGPISDPNNLVTACFDCNRGKGKIPLGVQRIKDDRKEAMQREREKQQQIKEYEEFLKEKQAQDGQTIEELDEYWSGLSGNKYNLNLSGIDALKRFLKFLTPAEIKDSMEIAAARIPATQLESRFKYFCGICHNKKGEKTGDLSRKTFRSVQKYYLSQRRGSGYHKEYLLKRLCGRYTEEILKEAIDAAFSEGQLNYWEAFCAALANLTGDEIPNR